MADLPEEIQKIYDSLHLTEKQFEVLDDFLKMALLARENRLKYNHAIELMAIELIWKELKERGEEYDQIDFGAKRTSCINNFKRQVGLKVSE